MGRLVGRKGLTDPCLAPARLDKSYLELPTHYLQRLQHGASTATCRRPPQTLSMQRKGRNHAAAAHLGRLRPCETDLLLEYGFPSKGETRCGMHDLMDISMEHPARAVVAILLTRNRRSGGYRLQSFVAQEAFYSLIAARFLAFCTEAGDRDALRARLAEHVRSAGNRTPADEAAGPKSPTYMSPLPPPPLSPPPSAAPPPAPAAAPAPSYPAPRPPSAPGAPRPPPGTDIDTILGAVRKLREALVAAKRTDDFAAQVYLFAVRLGILAAHRATYYPSLLHLLRVLHPARNLTRLEHAEAAGYLVLDAACRAREPSLAEAFALRRQHGLGRRGGAGADQVHAVLRALVDHNWVLWRTVRDGVDGYKARLMASAEPRMRAHALKAFGRAYLSVSRAFLERQVMATWQDLRADYGLGWPLVDDKVIIRIIHARS